MKERSLKQRSHAKPRSDVASIAAEKHQRPNSWTGCTIFGAATAAAAAAWAGVSLLPTSGEKADPALAETLVSQSSAVEEEEAPVLTGVFLEKYLGNEVARLQNQTRSLRRKLEATADPVLQKQLTMSLKELHKLPTFKHLGPLAASRHRYGTSRVVADAAEVTSYQRGMLLHDEMVEIIDVPSLHLPSPGVNGDWAAYNPSILPITWGGRSSFLVTYRLSTWNLCTWAGAGSPLERLPLVKGKKQTTSKVAATIWYNDLQVAVPLHTVDGLEHKKHYCNHHTGMVRMGVDDGRLFLVDGEPWLIVAVVAPKGHTKYCFHNLMLCPLELPETSDGQVRCMQKIPVRFDKADKISEQNRAEGKLQNVHQKNWVPFVHDSKLYLVFTMEPLVIIHTDLMTGECIEVSSSETSAMRVFHQAGPPGSHSTLGVHGGSPLIALPASPGGEFLGIGRVARGNLQYALFFFTLVSTGSGATAVDVVGFRISRISRIFCFASTSPHHRGLCETIQFAGGLLLLPGGERGSTLVVTYGTNDCEAKVAMLPLDRVLSMLRPAGKSKAVGRQRQSRQVH